MESNDRGRFSSDALLLKKACACLRYWPLGVKPEKPDFGIIAEFVLNNFYVFVFIDLTFIVGDNRP